MKKVWRNIVSVLRIMFFICLSAIPHQNVNAEGVKLPLIYSWGPETKSPECGTRVYVHARHVHTRQQYYENNTGLAIQCYAGKFGTGAYIHAGRLYNSYAYLTNVAGIGYRADLTHLYDWHTGVGVEADYLKYGVPPYTDKSGRSHPLSIREGGPLIFPLIYLMYKDVAGISVHMLDPAKVYIFSVDLNLKF